MAVRIASVLFLSFLVSDLNVKQAHGQTSEREELLAKGETLLIDFINARILFPENWACFIRAQRWGHVPKDEQIVTTNLVGLIAEARVNVARETQDEQNHSYFAFATQRRSVDFGPEGSRQGIWGQDLIIGDQHFRKLGSATTRSYFKMGEDNRVLNDPDDKEVRLTINPFDPFYLSVADHGSFLSGSVTRELMVDQMANKRKIVFAIEDHKKGKFTGIWRLGKTDVYSTLTFSQVADWLPVTAASRYLGPRSEELEIAELVEALEKVVPHSRSETKWMRAPIPNSKSVLVPYSINLISNGPNKDSRSSETAFYLQWRFGKEEVAKAIPKPDALDWRAPMSQLFDQDLERGFDPDLDATPPSTAILSGK